MCPSAQAGTVGVMTGLAGSGLQVSAKRRGYPLTAGVLLVMMLGGTLPVPLYVQCSHQGLARLVPAGSSGAAGSVGSTGETRAGRAPREPIFA